MTTLDMLRGRRDEILASARTHGAADVRVIGSIARGDAGAEDDVDLLVAFRPGASLLEHAGLMVELERLLGRKVDVIAEGGVREHLRGRVLGEAVPL